MTLKYLMVPTVMVFVVGCGDDDAPMDGARPDRDAGSEDSGTADTGTEDAGPAVVTTVIVGGPGDEVAHPGGGACITATCPDGMRVLSGGGFWDSSGEPIKITLDNNRPTAGDAWSICGFSADADMHNWFVQAVCASVDTVIVGGADDEAPHPGGGACISATCPAGMRVVGGGGFWDSSGTPMNITLDNSRPTGDDEWSICGFSADAGMHNWFVQAVCAPVDTVVIGGVSDEAAHPGGGTCIRATCPADMSVAGGGGFWDSLGNPMNIALDNDRPTGDDEWSLCGFSADADMHNWFVQAICI